MRERETERERALHNAKRVTERGTERALHNAILFFLGGGGGGILS